MKEETGGVVNKQFVGFKPKMYLFSVDESSEQKENKWCD